MFSQAQQDENLRTLSAYLDAPETASRLAWQDQGARLSVNPSLSVAFRHSGWARLRRLVVESLRRTAQPETRIASFADCGSHSYVLQSIENRKLYRLAGSSCHDRFCLPCANERSHAIALNVIEHLVGKQSRFLTLTLKATNDPLAVQLHRLYAAFQTLRRRAFWKRHVTGGVAFLECKWLQGTRHWHPHFHILIEGGYMHYQRLKSLWYEITGDSYIIDIRLVRTSAEAARYVTKYASKPFNSSYVNRPDLLDEAVVALKGRKLVVTFGTWRKVILARHVSEGAWEQIGSLELLVSQAAHGDETVRAILASITNRDLSELYARAPPPPPLNLVSDSLTRPGHLDADGKPRQLTWFGVWSATGTYRYPVE